MSTHDDDVPGLPRGVQLDLFAPGGTTPTYLATWILDRGSRCGQCGSKAIYMQRVEPHLGAYCAGCGRGVRWLGKTERARLAARGGDV